MFFLLKTITKHYHDANYYYLTIVTDTTPTWYLTLHRIVVGHAQLRHVSVALLRRRPAERKQRIDVLLYPLLHRHEQWKEFHITAVFTVILFRVLLRLRCLHVFTRPTECRSSAYCCSKMLRLERGCRCRSFYHERWRRLNLW